MPQFPPAVQEYRRKMRAKDGANFYSGTLHFLFPTAICLCGIIYSLAKVSAVSLSEALVVPLTFFYANLVEYLAHRGPMHRRYRLLRIVFKRHTLEHHGFFTHDAMAFESRRDFMLVLFPPWAIVIFFGLFATPVGIVLYHLLSHNTGYLFTATALGYFLNYEWFHLMFHFPETSLVARLPVLRYLRQHHARHHDPALMTRNNFNITWPICDWLFGTRKGSEK